MNTNDFNQTNLNDLESNNANPALDSNNITSENNQNINNEVIPQPTFLNSNNMMPETNMSMGSGFEQQPTISNPNENFKNNFEQNIAPESPKKGKGIIIGVIILIIALLGVLAGLLIYKRTIMSNPVSIIENSISLFGKEAKDAIEDYNKELKNNKKIQNDISLEVNGNTLDLVTKVDLEKKQMAGSLDVFLENMDFLNVKGVLVEDAAYFSILKDSPNNYVYNYDFSEVFKTLNDVEALDPILANFITYFGDSFKDTVSENDFTESSEKITLEGKLVTAKKHTLIIDKKLIDKLLDNYKTKLVNDEKLMNYLTDLYNKTAFEEIDKNDISDTKANIEDAIDEIKDSYVADEELQLSLFVKRADLVKIDFGVDNDNKFEIYVNDQFDLTLLADGEKVLKLLLQEKVLKLNMNMDDTKVDFTLEDEKYRLNFDDEFSVNGILKATDDTFELTFNTEIEGTEINGKLISKESHPSDLKIDIPSDALDASDYNTEIIFEEELETMPLYSLISGLLYPDYDFEYDIDYDYDNTDTDWEF